MAVHSILSSPSGLSSVSDLSCTSEKPSSNTSGTSKPVRSADRSSAGALMREPEGVTAEGYQDRKKRLSDVFNDSMKRLGDGAPYAPWDDR